MKAIQISALFPKPVEVFRENLSGGETINFAVIELPESANHIFARFGYDAQHYKLVALLDRSQKAYPFAIKGPPLFAGYIREKLDLTSLGDNDLNIFTDILASLLDRKAQLMPEGEGNTNLDGKQ